MIPLRIDEHIERRGQGPARSFLVICCFLSPICMANGQGLHVDDRNDFADLIYGSNSGVVILDATDTQSGAIVGFTLAIEAEAETPLNTMEFLSNLPFDSTGMNTDAQPQQIGQVAEAGADGFVFHSLGLLFPKQLTREEIVDYVELAIYVGPPGQGAPTEGGEFDVVELEEYADTLCITIDSNSNESTLDVDRNNIVNHDDFDLLLDLAKTGRGDVDLDGDVGFSDFLPVSANFGMPGMYSQGDIDCDGHVAFSDFLQLGANFGDAAGVTPVPEPNAFFLGVVAISGVFCGTRDRKNHRYSQA